MFTEQTQATFNPTNDMSIERLYDSASALASQSPVALDTAINIMFGESFGVVSDPVQAIVRDGDTEASILKINQAGTYRIKLAIQYGRANNAGTSILNFRALVNGAQAGRSVNARLPNANSTFLFTDEAWLTLPAGAEITYQLIRDSGGSNFGGLFKGITTGSTGWNEAPTCALRVERWI